MDMLEDSEMRHQIFQGRTRNLDEALARALEIEPFRRMEAVRGGVPSRHPVQGVESEDHDRSGAVGTIELQGVLSEITSLRTNQPQ